MAAGLSFDAVLFDMDGVITRTAVVHAAAWKSLFDDFLQKRAAARNEPFRPFDALADYRAYVDGKPRFDGVRSFLLSRGIRLPEGGAGDPPDAETVQGLGMRKDALFQSRVREHGVEVYSSTLDLVRALRTRGVKTAVVTSSRNGAQLIEAAHVQDSFDALFDGVDVEALKLKGKPDPDMFLACADRLGVSPDRCVVVEDAVAGVEAARRGGFGLAIGVDRGGNRSALAEHGADVVVTDLAEIGVDDIDGRVRAGAEAHAIAGSAIAWRIEQEGFDPGREHAIESIFTVGNGYLGVRGALASPLPGSQGEMFIAGIYDRKQPALPYSEPEFLDVGRGDYAYSELVSTPYPFRVRLIVDGEPLDLAGERWREHRRVLDLHQGILQSESSYETGSGRLTVRTRRCASLAERHLLLQEFSVVLENGSANIELDASLQHAESAERHPHLVAIDSGNIDSGIELLRFNTQASGFEICIASRVTLVGKGDDALRWNVSAEIGQPLTLRRYVSVFTSRHVNEPRAAALEHLHALRWEEFERSFAAHSARWSEVWARSDIEVAGSRAAEQALRFNAYHLTIAADRDPSVSVGARSLTGRAYEGHVFWDVEIFMLPFYLHTFPDVARSLLGYRHHTLDGARRRAAELGYRGACYAWESTVTGDDVTPRKILLKTTGKEIPIFTGTQQIHVTADVAYGVWRYWEATLDREFLRDFGAEILIETARFWDSRCVREGSQLHIRGVVGPDEYHHSVNDNAYTNWMARLNFEKAAWAARWLEKEFPKSWEALVHRCHIDRHEPEQWQAAGRTLYCPTPDAHGVIEQFEGFSDLEEYTLPKEERFKAPVSRLFDWDKINRLKLIKQADVLMLLFLFPEAFSDDVVAANYRYYEPVTDHGSSLSPAIHAAIAARIGLREDCERYWRQSLWLDLSNTMGNSVLGVHPACMGGTWQALVFGMLGVRFTESGPVAHSDAAARFPRQWRSLALKLAWRDQIFPIKIARTEEAR